MNEPRRPTAWIVSPHATERALIVAELDDEGVEARGLASLSDLFAALAAGSSPEVLVLEAQVVPTLDTWEGIQALAPGARTLLLLAAAGAPLPADHVLRRPFSIGELASRIMELARGG